MTANFYLPPVTRDGREHRFGCTYDPNTVHNALFTVRTDSGGTAQFNMHVLGIIQVMAPGNYGALLPDGRLVLYTEISDVEIINTQTLT